MKIKTWILISYLVVMILPLVASYILFAWISEYNNDQKVAEYIETSNDLQAITSELDDPDIYSTSNKLAKAKVEEFSNEQQTITLYNDLGLTIYSSNPTDATPYALSKEQLYHNLYQMEQGYRTYIYRAPVFLDQEIVGFYKIELARDKWIEGVTERSILMMGIFIIFFILLYMLVIKLVNKKLNKRLVSLKEEMTAFAHGKTLPKSETNQDEIGELQSRFYNMREQINEAQAIIEADQSKKEYMIASISHDLKTPLTSIKAYAESLNLTIDLTDEEKEEYTKIIIDKSDFMKQMLDDLLTYTLLQSPSYEMELVEVDGSEFFDMLVSGYEELVVKKGLLLHESASVDGICKVNPKQMMRVADNLMSNAIRHTDKGSDIWISAFSGLALVPKWIFSFVHQSYTFDPTQYVYLVVQNEGKGISSHKMNKIFDPLYQVDQSRSKKDDPGTGLGLSITKQIIHKHGGEVTMLSKEQVGTTVICSLPVFKRGVMD